MQHLLDFLLDAASRIYYFFDSIWTLAVNVVVNAWEWTQDAANNALIAARHYTQALINGVSNALNSAIDNLYYWFEVLWDKVDSIVTVSYEWVIDAINSAVAPLSDWLDQVWGDLVTYVDDQVGWLFNALDGVYSWVVDYVNQITSGWLSWVPLLEQVQAFFSPANIQRLTVFLDSLFDILVTIVSNPARWILDSIRDDLTDYIAGWLADLIE